MGKKMIKILFFSVLIWTSISSLIQRFKCESLTETELFKHIPNSFVCNWQNCAKLK